MNPLDLPAEFAGRTVHELFRRQAEATPEGLAIEHGRSRISYGELANGVEAVAGALRARGIGRGDRIAVLSENSPEYPRLILAAAAIGAIVACQNIRLAAPELRHCLTLVEPALIVSSARCRPMLAGLDLPGLAIADIETLGQEAVTAVAPAHPEVDPDDALLLIYTSGTTGLPKGALISQRAEVARMLVVRRDLGTRPGDAMLAWAPMYHIGGTDQSLATLMAGGTVVIVDGFRIPEIVAALTRHVFGWVLLVPGMIGDLLDAIEAGAGGVRGVASVGCMADLVAPALIARTTRLFDAPFLNSFGMTETGIAPLSGGLIPIGVEPASLSKQPNSYCEFRLIDPAGAPVEDGRIGEGAVRGPILFSGYWNAAEVNAREFVDGFFRMGDLFRRAPDGGYDFVDRARYLIKSGGENIYPAEIERVLLADRRVADVCVVRKPDPKWGEVPVAFVARADDSLDEAAVEAICRAGLAGFKRPRDVRFVASADLPRSTSGKILRHELEKRL